MSFHEPFYLLHNYSPCSTVLCFTAESNGMVFIGSSARKRLHISSLQTPLHSLNILKQFYMDDKSYEWRRDLI